MASQNKVMYCTAVVVVVCALGESVAMTLKEKQSLKLKVVEMFNHAYGNYMEHAFPADELMPLSCRGRYRGSEPSRGDVDDSLGNFTLTLVDTLDTLAVLGDIPAFEKAVKLIINGTKFDCDVIVSVFETNIRVLGGLLGGHVISTFLQRKKYAMEWYKDELLGMAKELGTRLLPAFDTPTGIPYPRINLKKGIDREISQNYKDTCTSCAGTMILEFAALSRLTGDTVFEEKAHKAMDYLWTQRHRSSDLVGTVINIHSGDWIRRESGVGAGIDSYYEYVLKAYILLGDDTYLERFNKHYAAVMKYVSQGPLLVDVHMHRPHSASRHFMDALLAFWPGLQVLKGDIQPAIETHEMLYQVMKKHNFLPEAFTTDFRVHWGQHPLRPEFVESTYFLYKATGDPYYLEVGKKVIENLNTHARVQCGFAALKDVTTGTHEDQMDSFVLAETFKYLYLLYAEKSDLIIDVDDYIFTTEAHLLPLTLSLCNNSRIDPPPKLDREVYRNLNKDTEQPTSEQSEDSDHNTCPNHRYKKSVNYAHNLRTQMKDIVDQTSAAGNTQYHCSPSERLPRLRASEFMAGNQDHLRQLQQMGIRLVTMTDGRIQLLHTASEAESPSLAEEGLKFMQEMIELSKVQQQTVSQHEPLWIQLISAPGQVKHYRAGPAQFGYDLKVKAQVTGRLCLAEPLKACTPIINTECVRGRIAVMERGDCMFIDKARHLEKAGAIGGIVIDHNEGSHGDSQPLFAMSGDGQNNVNIPLVFIFSIEGTELKQAIANSPNALAVLSSTPPASEHVTITSNIPTDTESPDQAAASQSGAAVESHDQPGSGKPQVTRHLEPVAPQVEVEVAMAIDRSQPQVPVAASNLENVGEDVINVITRDDGSRAVTFRFDKLKGADGRAPRLTDMYEDLVDVLRTRTNFNLLNQKAEFLTAIAHVLEKSFFGRGLVDRKTQELLDELAQELEIFNDNDLLDSEEPLEEEEQSGGVVDSHSNPEEEIEMEEIHMTHNGVDITAYRVHKTGRREETQTQAFQDSGIHVKIESKQAVAGPESYASVEDFNEELVQADTDSSKHLPAEAAADRGCKGETAAQSEHSAIDEAADTEPEQTHSEGDVSNPQSVTAEISTVSEDTGASQDGERDIAPDNV